MYWFTIFFSGAYFYFFALAIWWQAETNIIFYCILSPFVLAFYWVLYRFSSLTTGIYICYVAMTVLFGLAVLQGGIFSSPIVWTFTIVPVASFSLADKRIAIQMTILGFLMVLALYFVEIFDFLPTKLSNRLELIEPDLKENVDLKEKLTNIIASQSSAFG